MKSFTIQEIGSLVNGRVTGSAIQKFGGLEQVTKAGSNQITFIGNRKYAGMWAKSAVGLPMRSRLIRMTKVMNRGHRNPPGPRMAICIENDLSGMRAEPNMRTTARCRA